MDQKEVEIQLALGSLSDDMKRELATDPNTPVEVLTILSTDENWHIRYRVAGNPNTPAEVLTKLVPNSLGYYYVKYCLANNPNTPKEVLATLAADKDYTTWLVGYTNSLSEDTF